MPKTDMEGKVRHVPSLRLVQDSPMPCLGKITSAKRRKEVNPCQGRQLDLNESFVYARIVEEQSSKNTSVAVSTAVNKGKETSDSKGKSVKPSRKP